MAWLLHFVQFVKDKQNAKTRRLTVDDFEAATAAYCEDCPRISVCTGD